MLPKLSAVGSNIFSGCTALQIVDLPATKSIAANAFANCKSLTAVILKATSAIVTVQSTSFNGASSDWYVYVPKSMVNSYLNSGSQWENLYSDKIRAIEDYPDICG